MLQMLREQFFYRIQWKTVFENIPLTLHSKKQCQLPLQNQCYPNCSEIHGFAITIYLFLKTKFFEWIERYR